MKYITPLSVIAVLVLCITFIPYPISNVFAQQSQEESDVLNLFFSPKALVVSATRSPKPISQVAENITVVTSEQIEAMNAHTVAEVLNGIPGVFVNFGQGVGSFGSASLFYLQGSDERHVLVLLDGAAWNFLSSGAAETNSIPVGIIDRIEVIKGPASSAWGSSLGGVVNVITKPTGTDTHPEGSVQACLGEYRTQDYRAEVSGRAGSTGYYLFAGKQTSGGSYTSRDFDSSNVYAKFQHALTRDVRAGLTLGYSDLQNGLGDFLSSDLTSKGIDRTFFTTAYLDASLTNELGLQISLRHFRQKYDQQNTALGLGWVGTAGELFLDSIYDEETTGGGAKLVWSYGVHTAVLGADIDHGTLDETMYAGSLLQLYGLPPITAVNPGSDRWAVYANDTISLGRLSITPGIRYDDNSIAGTFVSPSIGATCRLGRNSIFRASAARGFTMPPICLTSGGALFINPNPSLKPETVWSYQAGVESSSLKYLWAKVTLFRHDLDDTLKWEPATDGINGVYVNSGSVRRQGIEFEVETVPFYNCSFKAGFAYVDLDPATDNGSTVMQTWNVGLRYDGRKYLKAQITGRYVDWDLDPAFMANYDDFIWDFNAGWKIWSQEKTAVELFFSAHNIFNGSQYVQSDIVNPGRWVEAGSRISF